MSLLKIKPFVIDDTTASDAFVKANGAFGTANSAALYANAAFTAANNASDSWVRNQANGAFIQANAAFTAANNASDSWVRNQANLAFGTANSGSSYANSAFTAANTADGKAVTAGSYANSAFGTANSAALYANAAFLAANNALDSWVRGQANAAFGTANSGASYANSAFTAANTADGKAVTSGSYANSAFGTANSAASYANAAFTAANSKFNSSGGTISGDTVVTGNLTVTGTRFYANTINSTVQDNIITLNSNVTGVPTQDAGIEINRGSSTNTSIVWKESVKSWQFTNDGTNYSNIAASSAESYANSAFTAANTADGKATSSGSYANSAFGTANSAALYANAAFTAANTADGKAVTAGTYANGAFIQANAAFTAANNASDSWVRNQANASFGTANSAALYANAAFIQANAAYNTANSGSLYANGAFLQANAAFTAANNASDSWVRNQANAAFLQANAAYTIATLGSAAIVTRTYTGNGATTNYTITTGSTVDNVLVTENGVLQTPTIDYTISGTTLAFVVAPINNVKIQIRELLIPSGSQSSNTANIAFDTANAAFIRANNSLNVQSGGTITGNLTIAGNFLPSANITYNLGSSTARWKDLYLSGNTIDLGGAQIKNDANTGSFVFVPIASANTPNPTALFISSTGSITTVQTTGGVISDANLTLAAANTANTVPTDVSINLAFIQANAAFLQANAAYTAANSASSAGNQLYYNSFTGDGTTTGFTLTAAPLDSTYTIVNIDGVFQLKSAYTLSGNTITFTAAPTNSSKIDVTSFANITLNTTIDTVARQTGASAFLAANTPQEIANSAALYANAAFIQANAAFTAANNASDSWVRNQANASFIQANAVFTQSNTYVWPAANSAGVYANAAFAKANTALTLGKSIAMAIIFGG